MSVRFEMKMIETVETNFGEDAHLNFSHSLLFRRTYLFRVTNLMLLTLDSECTKLVPRTMIWKHLVPNFYVKVMISWKMFLVQLDLRHTLWNGAPSTSLEHRQGVCYHLYVDSTTVMFNPTVPSVGTYLSQHLCTKLQTTYQLKFCLYNRISYTF